MGGNPKIWMTFQGRPVIEWTLRRFQEADVRQGVVVARQDDLTRVAEVLADLELAYQTTAGGSERYLSVRRGLQALGEISPKSVVLIHDAARFLTPKSLIRRVADQASIHGAALPVLEVPDTVKRVEESGQVESTVPRDCLRLAQTPQGFHYEIIVEAYRRLSGPLVPTDDAEVAERAGFPVWTVAGDPMNVKLTRPEDARIMAALAEGGTRDADWPGV